MKRFKNASKKRFAAKNKKMSGDCRLTSFCCKRKDFLNGVDFTALKEYTTSQSEQ